MIMRGLTGEAFKKSCLFFELLPIKTYIKNISRTITAGSPKLGQLIEADE